MIALTVNLFERFVKKIKPNTYADDLSAAANSELPSSLYDFELHNDNPELLVLFINHLLSLWKHLTSFFKPGDEKVCMKKPICVQKAATFVIDTKK